MTSNFFLLQTVASTARDDYNESPVLKSLQKLLKGICDPQTTGMLEDDESLDGGWETGHLRELIKRNSGSLEPTTVTERTVDTTFSIQEATTPTTADSSETPKSWDPSVASSCTSKRSEPIATLDTDGNIEVVWNSPATIEDMKVSTNMEPYPEMEDLQVPTKAVPLETESSPEIQQTKVLTNTETNDKDPVPAIEHIQAPTKTVPIEIQSSPTIEHTQEPTKTEHEEEEEVISSGVELDSNGRLGDIALCANEKERKVLSSDVELDTNDDVSEFALCGNVGVPYNSEMNPAASNVCSVTEIEINAITNATSKISMNDDSAGDFENDCDAKEFNDEDMDDDFDDVISSITISIVSVDDDLKTVSRSDSDTTVTSDGDLVLMKNIPVPIDSGVLSNSEGLSKEEKEEDTLKEIEPKDATTKDEEQLVERQISIQKKEESPGLGGITASTIRRVIIITAINTVIHLAVMSAGSYCMGRMFPERERTSHRHHRSAQ